MNVMEPTTRIRADENNKALIVSGSAADRFIIDRLIQRLDGSGRQFEVLQLRRLEASEVAESIAFLGIIEALKGTDAICRAAMIVAPSGAGPLARLAHSPSSCPDNRLPACSRRSRTGAPQAAFWGLRSS